MGVQACCIRAAADLVYTLPPIGFPLLIFPSPPTAEASLFHICEGGSYHNGAGFDSAASVRLQPSSSGDMHR